MDADVNCVNRRNQNSRLWKKAWNCEKIEAWEQWMLMKTIKLIPQNKALTTTNKQVVGSIFTLHFSC